MKPFDYLTGRLDRRQFFTMIELLFVIVIILLLTGLLLPGLAKSREKAQYTRWLGYATHKRAGDGVFAYYDFSNDGRKGNLVLNRAEGVEVEEPFVPAAFDLEVQPAAVANMVDGRWTGKGALLGTGSGTMALQTVPGKAEGELTLEFWGRLPQASPSVLALVLEAANGDGMALGAAGNQVAVTAQVNATNDSAQATAAVNDGRYHQFLAAANLRGGKVDLYMDGRLLAAQPLPGVAGSSLTAAMPFSFGLVGAAELAVDEVTVWNRALGAQEAHDLYRSSRP